MPHRYEVQILAEDDEPPAALRERFRVCLERRLARLETQGGPYPQVDEVVDILDAFEGPYVWEMTPEELEARPPVSVELLIVEVEPTEPPAEPATVKVTVRVPV